MTQHPAQQPGSDQQAQPTPEPRRGFFAGHKILTGMVGLVLLVVVVAWIAGGGDDADPAAAPSPSAPQTEAVDVTADTAEATDEAAPEETAGEPASESWTLANPAPAGSTLHLDTWDVSLGVTVLDASADVLAANQFNNPPAEGRSFIMVPIQATYTGDDSGTAWIEVSTNFVGNAGNTYGTSMDDNCGVVPSPLTDAGEVYPGATASGNVCVSVPTAEIEGGAWVVSEPLSFTGDKVFVAID